MSEARKCDRCHGFYDIENEQQDRKIPYEFKGDHINLSLWIARNGVRRDKESRWYDLCPKCMYELEIWLMNNEFPVNVEENETEDKSKLSCYFEYCKDCLSLFRKPPLPGETGYSEVRCGRWHTGIPLRGAEPSLIDSITPDMFMTEEAINKYFANKDEEE